MVYINRVDGDKTSLEGYCIPCARELNIKPVSDMLDNMNIPSEDLEAMSEQMMSMMNGEQSDDDLDGAEAGGAQAFPFLQNIFGDRDLSHRIRRLRRKSRRRRRTSTSQLIAPTSPIAPATASLTA